MTTVASWRCSHVRLNLGIGIGIGIGIGFEPVHPIFDCDADPDADSDRKKVEVNLPIRPASFQPEAALISNLTGFLDNSGTYSNDSDRIYRINMILLFAARRGDRLAESQINPVNPVELTAVPS